MENPSYTNWNCVTGECVNVALGYCPLKFEMSVWLSVLVCQSNHTTGSGSFRDEARRPRLWHKKYPQEMNNKTSFVNRAGGKLRREIWQRGSLSVWTGRWSTRKDMFDILHCCLACRVCPPAPNLPTCEIRTMTFRKGDAESAPKDGRRLGVALQNS